MSHGLPWPRLFPWPRFFPRGALPRPALRGRLRPRRRFGRAPPRKVRGWWSHQPWDGMYMDVSWWTNSLLLDMALIYIIKMMLIQSNLCEWLPEGSQWNMLGCEWLNIWKNNLNIYGRMCFDTANFNSAHIGIRVEIKNKWDTSMGKYGLILDYHDYSWNVNI